MEIPTSALSQNSSGQGYSFRLRAEYNSAERTRAQMNMKVTLTDPSSNKVIASAQIVDQSSKSI